MNEYLGCFHGDLTCGAMLQCMNGCPTTGDAAQTCLSNCLSSGSVAGQQAYYAIGDCIQQTCCPSDPAACTGTEYETCAQGAYAQQGAPCYDLVMACVNGTAVLPGLRLPIALPASVFRTR